MAAMSRAGTRERRSTTSLFRPATIAGIPGIVSRAASAFEKAVRTAVALVFTQASSSVYVFWRAVLDRPYSFRFLTPISTTCTRAAKRKPPETRMVSALTDVNVWFGRQRANTVGTPAMRNLRKWALIRLTSLVETDGGTNFTTSDV